MPGKARILIIDDDDDYRASTRALLEGEGYEVLEAATGTDGLAAARDHRPDLIVLDIMMAYLSEGYSIRQALKSSEEYRDVRDVPVIMASSVEVDPARLFDWVGDTDAIAPDAYLTKPLDIPKFLQRVRSLLAERQDTEGEAGSGG
jgi:CheY-like chemotaxis protein